MIKGTLADKIFGLHLNPAERVFYEIGKGISTKLITFSSSYNVIHIHSKNLAYIDNTIFSSEKAKNIFIENTQKELQEEAAVFDISQRAISEYIFTRKYGNRYRESVIPT